MIEDTCPPAVVVFRNERVFITNESFRTVRSDVDCFPFFGGFVSRSCLLEILMDMVLAEGVLIEPELYFQIVPIRRLALR